MPAKKKEIVKFDRSKLAGHATQTKKMAFEEANIIKADAQGFIYEGQRIRDPMDVIIVAAVFERGYFDRPYNPDETSSPACAAVSFNDDDLVPFSASPHKQSGACNGCPLNEYGTALQGKGKACGEKVKLALVPADFLQNPSPLTKVAYLRVPTTSIKNYRTYLKDAGHWFAAHGREFWTEYCMVTTIEAGPHNDRATGYNMSFAFAKENTSDAALEALYTMRENITEDILRAPDFTQYKPLKVVKKAPARKKAPAKKKAAARRK